MSKTDLRKAANIASNTITKLYRVDLVNFVIFGKICEVLSCDYGNLLQYVSGEMQMTNKHFKELPNEVIQSFNEVEKQGLDIDKTSQYSVAGQIVIDRKSVV